MASTSSIDYFKNTFLRNGLAKPSRYRIEFANIPNGGNKYSNPIFPAESLNLPTRGFITTDEQWFGPKRTVPIGNSYTGEVVAVFPVSSDQRERAFFEGWMSSIVPDHLMKWGLYPEQHNYSTFVGIAHMSIKTLDESDKVTSTYEFQEVYPSTIFPSSLGANMFNDYTRLQVAFKYRHYAFHSGDSPSGSPRAVKYNIK